MKGLNILGIIVALVALEALGFLWYGPLFRAQWVEAMRASGVTVAADAGRAVTPLVLGAVNTLIVIVGLSWALPRLGSLTLMSALTNAGLIWFFFNLTTMAIGGLFMQQTMPLLVINAGFQLLAYLIAGFCIAVVRLPARKPA